MNGDDKVEGGSLEHRTRIILNRAARPGEPIVDKSELAYLDKNGLHEEMTLQLSHAACNHVLRTARDAGAICPGCGLLLCSDCSKAEENFCYSCRRAVCGLCQETIKSGGEERVYCPRCLRRKARELLSTILIVTGVIMLGAVFLIRFL